jgi:hypothetical protein
LCNIRDHNRSEIGAGKLQNRLKTVRLGIAKGDGLFTSRQQAKVMRQSDDAQACIRSALRQRRHALGLTQEEAAGILGMLARTIGKLTALAVTRAKKPGHYGDGGGLYLLIGPTGAKSWTFRF